MKLHGQTRFRSSGEPFLARLETQLGNRDYELRLISGEAYIAPYRLRIGSVPNPINADVTMPEDFGYLALGDIVRFNPANEQARVLYRRNSRHNVLFFTERCNSRCLMCSQPPRDINDDYLVEDILRTIPWMSPETSELGISGGEPTLLQDKLVEVVAAVKRYLPTTSLHMLSNGRLFSYLRLAQRLAAIGHSNLMIGVPLYADTAGVHDFVVQAPGAFNQTIFGLLNLARVGIRIEIRMVVHRHTYERLPEFAAFVARNLPFVSQVSIMGLELMGYARSNLDSLWIDPADYQNELEECAHRLEASGLKMNIFNHPLCVLRPSLHRFARKSISDWKNIYLPECSTCVRRDECGGFFASATLRHSSHLRPFAPHLATGNTGSD